MSAALAVLRKGPRFNIRGFLPAPNPSWLLVCPDVTQWRKEIRAQYRFMIDSVGVGFRRLQFGVAGLGLQVAG